MRWARRHHERASADDRPGDRGLDFTSSLYLGLRHPHRVLSPWSSLTTGVPAALREAASAREVAAMLAALMGTEAATLAPSTLHVFWDLFVLGHDRDRTLFLDAGLYPIARWGAERAAARGVAVIEFAHHDADALRRQVSARTRGWPIVVTDGFCPRCGRAAPLAAYLGVARELGGRLVVDDSQALGILGRDPRAGAPYGLHGGGSLRWHGLDGGPLLTVASLAKGLGVPVAVLAGSRDAVRRFDAGSSTRVHCSPPSAASVQAARRALLVNGAHGEAMRRRLGAVVTHFRRRLAGVGLSARGGMFPVQTLTSLAGICPVTVHARLSRMGVSTVLSQGHDRSPRLTFVLTAGHSTADVEHAVVALASAVASTREGDES